MATAMTTAAAANATVASRTAGRTMRGVMPAGRRPSAADVSGPQAACWNCSKVWSDCHVYKSTAEQGESTARTSALDDGIGGVFRAPSPQTKPAAKLHFPCMHQIPSCPCSSPLHRLCKPTPGGACVWQPGGDIGGHGTQVLCERPGGRSCH